MKTEGPDSSGGSSSAAGNEEAGLVEESTSGAGSAGVTDLLASEILRVPTGDASLARPCWSWLAAGRSSFRMRSARPGVAKATCDKKKAGDLRELRRVCASWKLGSRAASEGEIPATWLRRASNWLMLGRRGKPIMCSPAGKRNGGEVAGFKVVGEVGEAETVVRLARFCLAVPFRVAA